MRRFSGVLFEMALADDTEHGKVVWSLLMMLGRRRLRLPQRRRREFKECCARLAPWRVLLRQCLAAWPASCGRARQSSSRLMVLPCLWQQRSAGRRRCGLRSAARYAAHKQGLILAGCALAATTQRATMCLQAWGEQVAKARRKRGGREGGVLLGKGYIDALAAVREQAASGLRVRFLSAVCQDALYQFATLTQVVLASLQEVLTVLTSCNRHAVSGQEVADGCQAAMLWGYEPDFELNVVLQRVLTGRLGFFRMASADLRKCLALLSIL